MTELLYYDPHAHAAYRIEVKALTVGEGVAVDSEQDAMTRRDINGRLLLTLQAWPLLKYATVRADVAALDQAPAVDDDGTPQFPPEMDWVPLEMTEDMFLNLPELVSWAWHRRVLDVNPHRNTSYEALKKALSRVRPAPSSATPTTASETPDTSDEPVSPAG